MAGRHLRVFARYGNRFQRRITAAITSGRGINVRDQNAWAQLTQQYKTQRAAEGMPREDPDWPNFQEIVRRSRNEVRTGRKAPNVRIFLAPVVRPPALVGPALAVQVGVRQNLDQQMVDLENARLGNEEQAHQEPIEDQGGNEFARQRIKKLTSTMGPWAPKTHLHGNFLYSKELQYTGKWRKGDENEVVQRTPNYLRTTKMGTGVPTRGKSLGEDSVEYGKTTDPNVVHIPSNFHFFIFLFFYFSHLWIFLNPIDTRLMTSHRLQNQQTLRNYRDPFQNVEHNVMNKPPRGINNMISTEFNQSFNQRTRQNGKM